MSSTLEHFSHPEHPLRLKEDVVVEANATCSVCDESVIGSPTYTCSSNNIGCESFYLHKSCAQLPTEIVRPMKDPHPLALLPRPYGCSCDICGRRNLKFAYACADCNFDICVICGAVSQDRVISHQGHPEHTLTLQRRALFSCDACFEETKDYSYVCLPCDFWIHKKCAASPPIIPTPAYHHHPLTLIFSIPVEHRYFPRRCTICKEWIPILSWSYYCKKCTFFVHLKCSTSTISFRSMEENVIVDNDSDAVQFPLPGVESLFDLIITQYIKFQVEIQGGDENRATISTVNDDPHIILGHWSHEEHPLELLQFTISVDHNDDDDNNDNDADKKALICDGCVQPITMSHPSYYACIECGFFLHSFCANKLPSELPAGASPFHPHHSLLLNQRLEFYNLVQCGFCKSITNGFYYECKTCDIKVDIRCVFLPTRIRHQSHKHHSLIQRPSTRKICSVSGISITHTLVYACETCRSFEISVDCAFYPNRMKHKYDDHSLILRLPPFFYEGVFYCQICEEQVNNQLWLYHCDECDQSFHNYCLCSYFNGKLGGTIERIIDNQTHKLALVIKQITRANSPPFSCAFCGRGYIMMFFFECQGCGFLACIFCCIRRAHGANKLRSPQA
ncbi:hypothetical protein DCAR_0209669 [Daucus carota subsp. sativus]|uniref:Phorbol-ester/DAG-type domain-containing protein n=1 Tax=Daucus carota subsp. sativus TaxID=79200 RepID=A0AAF0WIB2_DAUCS|nr:hypothetical protein DCAR_0209669 [Daucus carota subsp. sativus]